NQDTENQQGWVPLLTTPPYPEYTSGLTTVMGAASQSLTRVLGTDRIDLYITSAAAGVTRHYEFADDLNHDAIDARVWSGIHFRTSDEVGNAMGKKVGNWSLDHFFQSSH